MLTLQRGETGADLTNKKTVLQLRNWKTGNIDQVCMCVCAVFCFFLTLGASQFPEKFAEVSTHTHTRTHTHAEEARVSARHCWRRNSRRDSACWALKRNNMLRLLSVLVFENLTQSFVTALQHPSLPLPPSPDRLPHALSALLESPDEKSQEAAHRRPLGRGGGVCCHMSAVAPPSLIACAAMSSAGCRGCCSPVVCVPCLFTLL